MGKSKSVQYLRVTPPVEAKMELVIPVKEKPAVLKTLGEIRKLFGPKGQYWIQSSLHEYDNYNGTTGQTFQKQMDMFCLVGGVNHVDGRAEYPARVAIALAIDEWETERGNDDRFESSNYDNAVEALSTKMGQEDVIVGFNDDHASWNDVKAVLARAKVLVKKAATK